MSLGLSVTEKVKEEIDRLRGTVCPKSLNLIFKKLYWQNPPDAYCHQKYVQVIRFQV